VAEFMCKNGENLFVVSLVMFDKLITNLNSAEGARCVGVKVFVMRLLDQNLIGLKLYSFSKLFDAPEKKL